MIAARATALGLALLLPTSAALAWEPMRTPDGATVLAWPADVTGFATCGGGRGDADVQIALWDAMTLWWREGGLRPALQLSGDACAIDAADATIAVVRVDDPTAWSPDWGGAKQVIGFTIHTHDADGRLVDADIAFNDAHFLLDVEPSPDSGAVDATWLAAHELGHALGLGHPCGEAGGAVSSCFDLPPDQAERLTSALMFPSVAAGAREPRLGDDDRDAVRAVLDAGDPLELPVCAEADAIVLTEPSAVSWSQVDATGTRTALTGTQAPMPRVPFLVEVEASGGVRWIGRVGSPCQAPGPEVLDPDPGDVTGADVPTADPASDDVPVESPVPPGDDCACGSVTAHTADRRLPATGAVAMVCLLVTAHLRRRRTRPSHEVLDDATSRPIAR